MQELVQETSQSCVFETLSQVVLAVSCGHVRMLSSVDPSNVAAEERTASQNALHDLVRVLPEERRKVLAPAAGPPYQVNAPVDV